MRQLFVRAAAGLALLLAAVSAPAQHTLAAKFDLTRLALASEKFSGAEIEEAINSALYDAFSARKELSTEQILNAVTQTVPLAKTMDEQISTLREWAEGRARNASVPRMIQATTNEHE